MRKLQFPLYRENAVSTYAGNCSFSRQSNKASFTRGYETAAPPHFPGGSLLIYVRGAKLPPFPAVSALWGRGGGFAAVFGPCKENIVSAYSGNQFLCTAETEIFSIQWRTAIVICIKKMLVSAV